MKNFFIFLFLFLGTLGFGQKIPEKPTNTNENVIDWANWIDSDSKAEFEKIATSFQDTAHVVLLTMRSLPEGWATKQELATEIGHKWEIGGKNNSGVLILVITEKPDRGIFIATGGNVEGWLTDGTCGNISREARNRFFKNGRNGEGVLFIFSEIQNNARKSLTKEDLQPTSLTNKKNLPVCNVLLLMLFFVLAVIGLGQYLVERSEDKEQKKEEQEDLEKELAERAYWNSPLEKKRLKEIEKDKKQEKAATKTEPNLPVSPNPNKPNKSIIAPIIIESEPRQSETIPESQEDSNSDKGWSGGGDFFGGGGGTDW